jgi:hypothetical protein
LSGAALAEDGFFVFIPEGRWDEAVAALGAGRPFELAPNDAKLQPFKIAIE